MTFTADAQLASWKEAHNGGFTATFWFADEDAAREYFKPLTARKGKIAGQLFSMTLAELDDHGNAPVVSTESYKFDGGPMARWLVIDAPKDPLFLEFLGVANEHAAGVKIKQMIGCESRKEIDCNPVYMKKANELISYPYTEWLRQHEAVAV